MIVVDDDDGGGGDDDDFLTILVRLFMNYAFLGFLCNEATASSDVIFLNEREVHIHAF